MNMIIKIILFGKNEQINSDKLKEDENYWISKWKDKEIPFIKYAYSTSKTYGIIS